MEQDPKDDAAIEPQDAHEAAVEPFVARGLVTEVLYPIKSGKEATVYCCRAGPAEEAGGRGFLAAKVYRERRGRGFKNDAVYQEGRWHWARNTRATRAFRNGSAFGREVQQAAWVGYEWETLRALHAAGVDVPRPVASAGSAILMELFGTGDDEGTPAPMLATIRPESAGEAQAILDALYASVERMLARNVIHGDLSAYNVLYAGGRFRIIDLPQAVDPRFNPSSFELLARDLRNVHAYCARFGARADPEGRARELWRLFMEGRL